MKVSCFAKCLIIVILLLLLYVPVVNAYSFSSILVPYSDPANTWVYISSNVPDNAEVKDAAILGKSFVLHTKKRGYCPRNGPLLGIGSWCC